MRSDLIFIIPARAGSKGLPGKNYKLLGGKPLINYSLEFARLFTTDDNICVTTNDENVIKATMEIGYQPKFIRSEALCSDMATSAAVIRDALTYYNSKYKAVVLLQPTTPFRSHSHVVQALELLINDVRAVVGVKESKANPYFNLFEEDAKGNILISKDVGNYSRRQDVPRVYEINGALYVFTYEAAVSYNSIKDVGVIKKVVMGEEYSIDIDTSLDWLKAEYYLKELLNEKY